MILNFSIHVMEQNVAKTNGISMILNFSIHDMEQHVNKTNGISKYCELNKFNKHKIK